jgi:hypothetical protein
MTGGQGKSSEAKVNVTHDMRRQSQMGGESTAPNHQQTDIKTWVASTTLRPIYPGEYSGTHCAGGRVGLGVGKDGMENLALQGLHHRTFQDVASRYID